VIGAFTNLTRTLGNVFGQAIASTVVVAVMVSQGFDIALKDIDAIAGADRAFTDGWRFAHFLLTGYALAALALALRTKPAGSVGSRPMKPVIEPRKR